MTTTMSTRCGEERDPRAGGRRAAVPGDLPLPQLRQRRDHGRNHRRHPLLLLPQPRDSGGQADRRSCGRTRRCPFTISKDMAVDRFMQWVSKKKFVPKGYFARDLVNNIQGVYYPHFVTDCEVDGSYEGEGQNTSIAQTANYTITTTQHLPLHAPRGYRLQTPDAPRAEERRPQTVRRHPSLPAGRDEAVFRRVPRGLPGRAPRYRQGRSDRRYPWRSWMAISNRCSRRRFTTPRTRASPRRP